MILYEEDKTGKLTPCSSKFKNRRELIRDIKAYPEKYTDPFDRKETKYYKLLSDFPSIAVKMKSVPEIKLS